MKSALFCCRSDLILPNIIYCKGHKWGQIGGTHRFPGYFIAIHRKPHTVLRRLAVQPRTVFDDAPCLKLSVDGYTPVISRQNDGISQARKWSSAILSVRLPYSGAVHKNTAGLPRRFYTLHFNHHHRRHGDGGKRFFSWHKVRPRPPQ